MRWLAILLSVALLAAACASSTNDAVDVTTQPSMSVDVDATTTAAPTTTTEAPTTTKEPPLVYNLVGGGQLDPGDLEAQDTVLWFWAPW